jgi:murein DD-endopeptidase MepM/ murein hydrolase activator NlpD
MRQVGASPDDINILVSKRFIIPFDSGVIVLKHWKINNYIRNDRYTETKYIEERSTLMLDAKGAYTELTEDGTPLGIPNDNQRYTQDRIGEERIGKDTSFIHSAPNEENEESETHVENDVIYYPVPDSTVDKALYTTFENSWMNERTFGGKRGHEGIDIMVSENKRGLFPVVSMSDGVITNIGWGDKGGYRIGITADSGIYYYYAHLDSYSEIKKGDYIKAGQLIGFVGDSGYGPEGTVGKFPVHLHVGIYLYKEDKEVSVNPYYVLKFLENKKLKYTYS